MSVGALHPFQKSILRDNFVFVFVFVIVIAQQPTHVSLLREDRLAISSTSLATKKFHKPAIYLIKVGILISASAD